MRVEGVTGVVAHNESVPIEEGTTGVLGGGGGPTGGTCNPLFEPMGAVEAPLAVEGEKLLPPGVAQGLIVPGPRGLAGPQVWRGDIGTPMPI